MPVPLSYTKQADCNTLSKFNDDVLKHIFRKDDLMLIESDF